MKRTVFVLLLSMVYGQGFSQMAVTNPTLESTAYFQLTNLKSMTESIQMMQEAQKKAEEIKEKVDWIKELQSLQETIVLMERISCTIKDLDVNLSLAYELGLTEGSSCWVDFEYHVNFTRLRQSVEFINVILTEGFNMSRGERLDVYYKALAGFTDSQHELMGLKDDVEALLEKYENSLRQREAFMEFNSKENKARWDLYKD